MVPVEEYFRSVEIVWLLWAAAALGLIWLTRQAVKGIDWKGCSSLLTNESVLTDEDGAAYSLSYVMVFPIYLALVLLVIECTLILVVKLGTIYAAYSAARSQVVWQSLVGFDQARVRSNQAAVQAMAPYASSWPQHARRAGISSSSGRGEDYFEVYRDFANAPANERGYVVRKYRWAEFATKVRYSTPSQAFDANIKATVEYRMPLHAPIIGRLLGQRFTGPGGAYYLYVITSSVSLQDEAAQNEWKSIGFPYVPQ